MTTPTKLTITNESGRIDRVLTDAYADWSRALLGDWIKAGHVTVNGKTVKAAYKVTTGDEIVVTPRAPSEIALVPEAIPLTIIYEDDDLLVVNKPQGMVVHPAAGHQSGTLVNALLHHAPLSTINGEYRPGIVHRIDRDTSGLLMVAKNNQAHAHLAAQLKAHKNERTYYALVKGVFSENQGHIDAPIGRHPVDRKKQAIVADGRNAITHFEVVTRFEGATLLKITLETGRTHQIRVHMAYIGHPVIGDPVYGHTITQINGVKLHGQLLHAQALSLTHPVTGDDHHFVSDLPAEFVRVLRTFDPNYDLSGVTHAE